MARGEPERKSRWFVRWRFGLVPLVFGILIIVIVVMTGERFSWMLWIAVPFLMIGLGYLFIVSTFESMWVFEKRIHEEKEKLEKDRSLERPPGR
jgi:amino acid transporter